MIKHLSGCEEKIVEELAWQSNSSLWSHLRRIKLNTSCSTTSNSISQMDIAFPLNDDVYVASTHLTQYHLHYQHHHIPHQSHSKITATLSNTSDMMNTSTGTSSPIKQAPTITRVVCNNIDSSPLKSNITLTQQQQQIQSQLPSIPSAAAAAVAIPPRLKNVSKFVACFFRKFYALANTRIRSLIEKLELAHASLDLFNQNKNVNVKHFYSIFI